MRQFGVAHEIENPFFDLLLFFNKSKQLTPGGLNAS